MRVLFATQPLPSHLSLIVPLARALQERGHTVAIASGASLAATIEGLGFISFACGLSVDTSGTDASSGFDPGVFFYGRGLSLMIDELAEVCREWRPDLLVNEPLAHAPIIVGELLDIPYATVGETALRPWYIDHVVAHLAPTREAYQLPADPKGLALRRYLGFERWPPSIVPHDAVIPSTCQFVNVPPFNRTQHESLPSWFAELPSRPIVHVTLGTLWNQVGFDLYAALLLALRDEPYSLIVTVGNVDTTGFGPQPENVFIERYVSHALLLPRCDVLVTHAGFGTVLAALDCALPFLSVPLMPTGDQPYNAELCAAVGISLTLAPERLAPESVKTAIRSLLNDPSFRERARQIKAEKDALPDATAAAVLLERLARERKPITKA